MRGARCDTAQCLLIVLHRQDRRRRGARRGELKGDATKAVCVLRGGEGEGGEGGRGRGGRGAVADRALRRPRVEGTEGVSVGVVSPGEDGLRGVGDDSGMRAAAAEVWAGEVVVFINLLACAERQRARGPVENAEMAVSRYLVSVEVLLLGLLLG